MLTRVEWRSQFRKSPRREVRASSARLDLRDSTPACPHLSLIFNSVLCKLRSVILHHVIAFGSGVIDLLRAVIQRKSSVGKNAGSWYWKLNVLSGDSRPDGMPIVGTVEQITVGPSIRSRVRPTASGKKSWLKLRRLAATQNQFKRRKQSARVIQIAQKLLARENLLVSGQAVARIGSSIRKRLIKNSVARCVTTLYARQ